MRIPAPVKAHWLLTSSHRAPAGPEGSSPDPVGGVTLRLRLSRYYVRYRLAILAPHRARGVRCGGALAHNGSLLDRGQRSGFEISVKKKSGLSVLKFH